MKINTIVKSTYQSSLQMDCTDLCPQRIVTVSEFDAALTPTVSDQRLFFSTEETLG